MFRRHLPVALIRILAILALLAASVGPAAAESSSSPAVTLATSVGETTATVTVDTNRGTQQIASCAYVLDSSAAASCGSASASARKASRYIIDLTDQSIGAHTITVTIVLTDHGTASNATTFTIVATENDTDGDGVPDKTDNCPMIANADQLNTYGSAAGDACEDTDANGTPDVSEPNICVSVDGVPILGPVGTARCGSTKSATDRPDTAIADGDGAEAFAGNGDGSAATAIGVLANASADQGDGNSATATGDGSTAQADNGDNNTATANGANALAHAGFGNDNSATANGDSALASGIGNSNTATATGDSAVADANGANNSATATGDHAVASAISATGCTVVNGSCT